MPSATFDRPDLSAFTRLDGLGLEVTGQCIEADRAVLACRIVGEDRWCRRCGCQGICRDTVVRRLAHEPCGWRPTIVHVSVGRYRCQGCSHVWRQDMSQAADPRVKLSRGAVRWALTGVVVHHVTVARIPRPWACPGRAANTAVLAEGARLLINDPARFEGVRVIGVDEHVWRHTPYGDKNRHRHLGCDARPRSQRSLPFPGHGPGPIQGVSFPGDRGQCRGTTTEHRSSPWAPHQPKLARNLGTLTFHRYRENRRIPTM